MCYILYTLPYTIYYTIIIPESLPKVSGSSPSNDMCHDLLSYSISLDSGLHIAAQNMSSIYVSKDLPFPWWWFQIHRPPIANAVVSFCPRLIALNGILETLFLGLKTAIWKYQPNCTRLWTNNRVHRLKRDSFTAKYHLHFTETTNKSLSSCRQTVATIVSSMSTGNSIKQGTDHGQSLARQVVDTSPSWRSDSCHQISRVPS